MLKPLKGDYKIIMRFNEPAKWFKCGKHLGVDWACPKGTPLIAPFDGVVSFAAPYQLSGYGREVILRSSDSQFEALFGHLSVIDCKFNQVVKAGDVIGQSGNSGFVISLGGGGYHLHFGLKRNGNWVDPLKYIENENQLKIPIKNEDEKVVTDNLGFITTGYVVKKGETLWGIAKDFYNDGNLWVKIAEENKIKNARMLKIGQVLRIPGFK